jgi:hypothetical protein
MKRFASFLGGVAMGGLVFGTAGGFLGYELAHAGEPSVIVRNLTRSPIRVRLNTDIGESYPVEEIAVAESHRIRISGRDKALWITVTTATGDTRKSEEIYVTSQGTVFAAVSDQSITIDYEL